MGPLWLKVSVPELPGFTLHEPPYKALRAFEAKQLAKEMTSWPVDVCTELARFCTSQAFDTLLARQDDSRLEKVRHMTCPLVIKEGYHLKTLPLSSPSASPRITSTRVVIISKLVVLFMAGSFCIFIIHRGTQPWRRKIHTIVRGMMARGRRLPQEIREVVRGMEAWCRTRIMEAWRTAGRISRRLLRRRYGSRVAAIFGAVAPNTMPAATLNAQSPASVPPSPSSDSVPSSPVIRNLSSPTIVQTSEGDPEGENKSGTGKPSDERAGGANKGDAEGRNHPDTSSPSGEKEGGVNEGDAVGKREHRAGKKRARTPEGRMRSNRRKLSPLMTLPCVIKQPVGAALETAKPSNPP